MGCSLNEDRTVAVLYRVASDSPNVNYAIVQQPRSRRRFIERSRFLAERKILPIWYPHGQHDCIERFLAHLVYESKNGEHMFLEIGKCGLEIYLTGNKVDTGGGIGGWDKHPLWRYLETPNGYLLFGFKKEEIGDEFKHFVVCNDREEEVTEIKRILDEAGYGPTWEGSNDDLHRKLKRIWFLLRRDYKREYYSTKGFDDPMSNNLWVPYSRS